MKKSALFIIGLSFAGIGLIVLIPQGGTSNESGSPGRIPGYGLLSDFEGNDPVAWRGVEKEIVRDSRCAEGSCLKVVYPKGGHPGLSAAQLPADWSGFSALKFDAFNPSRGVVNFGISIADGAGMRPYFRGNGSFEGEFALQPGKNEFELDLTGLRVGGRNRLIDTTRVMQLAFFAVEPQEPVTLYLDNIRLDKVIGSETKGIRQFDFGTERSRVWPGFIKVTDKTLYRKDLGYGWARTQGLRAEDCPYPDPLFGDWVRGRGQFNVDLPRGRYVVYAMLEDPGSERYYQHYRKRRVLAEGRAVIDETLSAKRFFKDYYFAHLDHEDAPGEDIFQNYLQKRFVWRRFVVDVADNQLNLSFARGDMLANTISALIMAPESESAGLDKHVAKLDTQRRIYVGLRSTDLMPPQEVLGIELKNEFAQAGAIVFMRDPSRALTPRNVPLANEVKKDLRLTAARGERTSFPLGIYPLRDIGRCRIEVGRLVNEKGDSLSADPIRVRMVQYKLKKTAPHGHTARGELLRAFDSVDLRQEETRYLWCTLSVPREAAGGAYHGTIKLRAVKGGQVICAIPVSVDVLPFELVQPDIPIGLFYQLPFQYDWFPGMQGRKRAEIRRQLKDIREHGMNTLVLTFGPAIDKIHPNGDVEMDFKQFDAFLRAYKRSGFDQPISCYGAISIFKEIYKRTRRNQEVFEAALISAFRQVNAHARSLTGNDILVVLADGVSDAGHEETVAIIAAAKTLTHAGLTVTAYLRSPKDRVMFPYLKTVAVSHAVKINERLLRNAAGRGADLWLYDLGRDRFTFGCYLWKTMARGRVERHYQLLIVDPYFDLDGQTGDQCASYPGPQEPINTVWFELASEGVNDYRYLLTLKSLIEKKGAAKGAMDGKKILENMSAALPVELRENTWRAEDYRQFRRAVSDAIRNLAEAGRAQ